LTSARTPDHSWFCEKASRSIFRRSGAIPGGVINGLPRSPDAKTAVTKERVVAEVL
jgi:hypothetical protein